MGWKLLDRPKTLKATRKLADLFVEMDAAPHDRPLSERRLQVYEKMLAAGQFRPVTWASALCRETGGVYRVNGKHTSILLSGLEVMPDFYITIEEYECDTLEDVAKLYATFDSTMQSRSARDIYHSFAATSTELVKLPSKVITTAVSGITYAQDGPESYKKTPAERAEVLLDYPDFVVWLSVLIQGGPTASEVNRASKQRCAHLLRQPSVAAMFATWNKAKAASTEFWEAVRDETGIDPNLPDRKLGRYLMLVTMDHRAMDRPSDKISGSVREVYVRCLHCWNAWRKKEITSMKYFPNAKVPGVL